jgi:hypothetical protein
MRSHRLGRTSKRRDPVCSIVLFRFSLSLLFAKDGAMLLVSERWATMKAIFAGSLLSLVLTSSALAQGCPSPARVYSITITAFCSSREIIRPATPARRAARPFHCVIAGLPGQHSRQHVDRTREHDGVVDHALHLHSRYARIAAPRHSPSPSSSRSVADAPISPPV